MLWRMELFNRFCNIFTLLCRVPPWRIVQRPRLVYSRVPEFKSRWEFMSDHNISLNQAFH